MRIIPVIDVMGGQVVRAIGGRRDEYRPIRSQLTDSTDPVEVGRALIRTAQANELYIADLDAIIGVSPARFDVHGLARRLNVTVWADIGIRTANELVPFYEDELIRPVLGSETVDSLDVVGVAQAACQRIIFSLDLRNGHPLGNFSVEQRFLRPFTAAKQAIHWNARTIITIELTAVGERRGSPVGDYVSQLRKRFPEVELVAGGGIRDWDDVRRLEDAGADAVLVASALHDGTLTFPRPAG